MSREDVSLEMDAEKAVKEPLTSNEADSPAKVQFVSTNTADGKNGEVSIVSNSSPRKSGLSKEELMKYADDPFWVRLRLILFVLFWVIWVAMLVGAIAIIIIVPKCPPSSRLKWYQKTNVYEVNVKSFVNGLLANLNYINSLAVETIALNTFHGIKFTEIDPSVGKTSDFENFVKLAETGGKKVILAFDFRYTSVDHEWFNKSAADDPEYVDYYLWSSKEEGEHWKRLENHDKWYFTPKINGIIDGKYAQLNFSSNKVVNEVKNVLKHWKSMKVNGFQLLNGNQLLPKEVFEDRTSKNVEVIKRLRKFLYTKVDVSGKTGFFVDVDNDNETADYTGNEDSKIADLVVSDFFTNVTESSNAMDVRTIINDHYNALPVWKGTTRYGPWSACRVSSRNQRLESRVGKKMTNMVLMTFLMLPNCTQVWEAGDELDVGSIPAWSVNATYYENQNSTQLKMVRKLNVLRRQHIDSLLMGKTEIPHEHDDDVLTIVRYYPEFESFLLIANFGNEKSLKLNSTKAGYLPEKGKVILSSEDTPLKPPIGEINLKEPITMGSKQSVLVQFTPVAD